MQPNVRLTEKEKAVVRIVYTRKQKTRTLRKQTATHGYKKQYEVTKLDRYYDTRQEAEAARDAYNDNEMRKKQSRTHDFPDTIEWDWFAGTAVQDPKVWWPRPEGAWLYDHKTYDDWSTEELLEEDMEAVSDDMHTTKDFFNILFKTPRFRNYFISNNNKEREWKLYERV